ncbi:PLDc N-terminal domain-containing protein [Kribbella sp. NPDC048928]|uniref:PLDc N-terminal domain-containing protein n=1 Tax=Kribbella sp. NPDC048928 TaxID=3364111 RepID=UPI00372299B0
MMLLQTATQTDQTFGVIGGALLIGALVAYVLLVVGAFFSALFSSATAGMKLVWIVFIVIAPFIGSLLWFLVGKRNAQEAAYG